MDAAPSRDRHPSLERARRARCNREGIVARAYRALSEEFAAPSDDLVRLIGMRISAGRLTAATRETIRTLIVSSAATLIRDRVNERLMSALTVANPVEPSANGAEPDAVGAVVTSQDEIDGFQIIRAIASRLVDPQTHRHARCPDLLRDLAGR